MSDNTTQATANIIVKHVIGVLLILIPAIGLMMLGGWDVMFVALPALGLAFCAMLGKPDGGFTKFLWMLAIICGMLTWAGFAWYIAQRM